MRSSFRTRVVRVVRIVIAGIELVASVYSGFGCLLGSGSGRWWAVGALVLGCASSGCRSRWVVVGLA